jgi:hypothetical protein
MDLWAPDGLIEAAIDDRVPAGAQFDITSDETGDASAIRIISANATVVGVALSGEGKLAGGPATPGLASGWILAGAGARPGVTTAWIFNPSPDSVTVEITPITGGEPIGVEVAGSSLGSVELPITAAGYLLGASGPVAAAWTTSGVGLAYAPGLPIDG